MDRLSIITDDGGLFVHSDLFDEDERDIVARELLEQYPGGDLWTVPLPSVSYTHLTLPTIAAECRSRWSPYP